MQRYAKVIEDYSAKFLRSIFDTPIKNDTEILANGWLGHKSLKEDYSNLRQTVSYKRKNFKMLHVQIRNFKNWLSGVNLYCN